MVDRMCILSLFPLFSRITPSARRQTPVWVDDWVRLSMNDELFELVAPDLFVIPTIHILPQAIALDVAQIKTLTPLFCSRLPISMGQAEVLEMQNLERLAVPQDEPGELRLSHSAPVDPQQAEARPALRS